ncbi:putative phospholipid-transporting ATPase DRS2 [Gossypium arboreum]|uniref:Putative phospholipid-transporting ATPase DRS2 n=1 Tax=Gossypium arboreum TaxID=29729 RepID=A0A0B0PPV3_GOSAR|nr:putative phospholipid-transporting ATPase DRS2 [Gossypium arboreum]
MFIKLSLFVYGLLSFRKLTLCVYHLFYRYRSYRKLEDRRGSSPHYQTSFWYLFKM